MKWKNAAKLAACFGAFTAAVAGINHAIFHLARRQDKEQPDLFYQWKYGEIHYQKEGSGPPLLLIHGLDLGCSHKEFTDSIKDLAKKFTVYAVDLPGYGYSEKPKITYTAFIYTYFLQDFLTQVVGQPCFAIGANGGGMILTIAAKLYPQWFQKIMLISPTGITDPVAQNRDIFLRTLWELPLKGTTLYNWTASRRSIKKFLRTQGFYAPERVNKELVNQFYFGAHGTNGNVRFAHASFRTHYMNLPITEYFKQLTMPVVVLWGEENRKNPVENMDVLEKLRPEEAYYIFEETRLFPHMENTAAFVQLVKEQL